LIRYRLNSYQYFILLITAILILGKGLILDENHNLRRL
jgi:hypothetical protein